MGGGVKGGFIFIWGGNGGGGRWVLTCLSISHRDIIRPEFAHSMGFAPHSTPALQIYL